MTKVLVVDDEQAITDGLVAMFGLESIEADGAYDREGAEHLLSSEFYAVILADLRLRSEEDGLRLIESIRRLSPRSRIATLTGFATPESTSARNRRCVAPSARRIDQKSS